MITTEIISEHDILRKQFDDKIAFVSKGLADGDFISVTELEALNQAYHEYITEKYTLVDPASVIVGVENDEMTVIDMIRNETALDTYCRDAYKTIKPLTVSATYPTALPEIKSWVDNCIDYREKLRIFREIDW